MQKTAGKTGINYALDTPKVKDLVKSTTGRTLNDDECATFLDLFGPEIDDSLNYATKAVIDKHFTPITESGGLSAQGLDAQRTPSSSAPTWGAQGRKSA